MEYNKFNSDNLVETAINLPRQIVDKYSAVIETNSAINALNAERKQNGQEIISKPNLISTLGEVALHEPKKIASFAIGSLLTKTVLRNIGKHMPIAG